MLNRAARKKIFFDFNRLLQMGMPELTAAIVSVDQATFDKALTTKIEDGDTLYHFLIKNKNTTICYAMMQKASSAALSQAIQIEDAQGINGYLLTLKHTIPSIDLFGAMVAKVSIAAIDQVICKQDKENNSGLFCLLLSRYNHLKEQRFIQIVNKASQQAIDKSMNLINKGGFSAYMNLLVTHNKELFLALQRKASQTAKNYALVAKEHSGCLLEIMSSDLDNNQFNEIIRETSAEALGNALIQITPRTYSIDPSTQRSISAIGWVVVAKDQPSASFQLILSKCFYSLKQVSEADIQYTAHFLRENKECGEEDAQRFLEVARYVKQPYKSICENPEGFLKFCKSHIPDKITMGFDYLFWISFIEDALIQPKQINTRPDLVIKSQLAILLGKLHLAQQKGKDNNGNANFYFLSVTSPEGLSAQDCLQIGVLYKELSLRPSTTLPKQIEHHRKALEFYYHAAKTNDPDALTVFTSEIYSLLDNPNKKIDDLVWDDSLEQDYQQAVTALPARVSDPQILFMKCMTQLRLYVDKRKSETWHCFGWLGYSEADAQLREAIYKKLKKDVDNHALNTAAERAELNRKLTQWLANKRISGGRRQQCATILRNMLEHLQKITLEIPIPKAAGLRPGK